MITISTETFEAAHGRKPRGTGMWAFYFGRNGFWTLDPEFAPGTMKYSEACKWAKKQARSLDCSAIIVAS